MQLESGPVACKLTCYSIWQSPKIRLICFPGKRKGSGVLLVSLREENTFSLMQIPFLCSIKLPHLTPPQKYEVKVRRSKLFYGTGESGPFTIVTVRSLLQANNGGTLMTGISANKQCSFFNTGL